jgi:hypothetical protein
VSPENAPGRSCGRSLRPMAPPPCLRPGFMRGAVDDQGDPLPRAAQGARDWLPKLGFGHSESDWHRLVERLSRSGLVGATIRDPAQLPRGRISAVESAKIKGFWHDHSPAFAPRIRTEVSPRRGKIREASACLVGSLRSSGSCSSDDARSWTSPFAHDRTALHQLCQLPRIFTRLGSASRQYGRDSPYNTQPQTIIFLSNK